MILLGDAMTEAESAIEQFYEAFEPMQGLVYGLILSLVRNREDALDILQDTIVLAIRHYDQLKDKSMLKPWILRIAKNESYTYLRKNSRSRELLTEPILLSLLPVASKESVEQSILRSEETARLICALQDLDEVDRLILYLRFHEDMKLGMIAEVTGFTLPKVKSRLSRVCKKLRRVLEKEILHP